MNRIISATIAAGTAAVMLFASCQRDELQGGSISGEEVSVSISATMPIDGGAVVKSNDEPGNASEVNRCIMGVYLNDDGMSQPKPMGDKVVVRVDGTTHKAEFGDLQLVSGHKYLLVFWADNATEDSDNGFEDNHYNTADFPEVTFKVGDTYQSNDDTRDAFFASYPIEVNGPSSHDINLHRPFGQLNITTNDYRTVAEDFNSLLPTQVKIDFSGIDIPTGIDLLTGELTEDDKESSLVSGPVDIADVSYPIAADGCRQLSFDYIFAPYEEEGEEQQLVLNEFKMHFQNGGQETISAYTFQNIPVRRNYRTNVSGNLLTDRTGIDVEVVPDFNEPAIEINTEEELVDVLTNGGDAVLTGDITVSAQTLSLTEGETASLDLDGHTITFNAKMTAENASVTFTDGTIVTQNLAAVNDHALSVGTNGTLTLDGITLESNGSCVAVNGATSGGTLTVRNSKITTAAYGVATNASAPESKNVTITLENSEFTGSDPVFINIPCTLNMTGCTLNGNMHGMVLRGGTANVENCHISLTYPEGESREKAQEMANYFQSVNWATGNAVNIAAVTVGNKVAEGNSSYKYPSVLNIENCVIESAGGHADLFPALYVWANQEAENGVTITYDGDTKFYGDRIYGNNGANITVNGAAVSDEGDTRP